MSDTTSNTSSNVAPVTVESIREMLERFDGIRREWADETGLPAEMMGCRVVVNPYLPEGAFALDNETNTAIVLPTEDGYKVLHWRKDDFFGPWHDSFGPWRGGPL